MTATDLLPRLAAIGAMLARRLPVVLAALIAFLESIARAFDTAHSDRYEIRHKIGAGGQAEVLLGAVHGAEGFQRPVAIKLVRADAPNASRLAAMLIEEALLAAPLSHPNVVPILDLARDQAGQLFLVMEHVDGADLGKLIATGPVPHPVVIFVVREVLSGLGYIHDFPDQDRTRGIVHCDVAPDNVLLSREGAVKLADFGVARALVGTTTAATSMPVGKPGYLSPEQARGEELDGRSDLYAVGIVLWELLAHRRLPVGAHTVPRPSELRQGVPGDLEAVAMRLLASNREERYQTAELAALDLARCEAISREGRAELAQLLAERFPLLRKRRPSSPPEPQRPSDGPITVANTAVPTGVAPRSDRSRASTMERRWWQRRRWRWLAIGVLLVV